LIKAGTAMSANAASSMTNTTAWAVVFGWLPPKIDDGMLKIATPTGTSTPATTVRHTRPAALRRAPASALRPTNSITSSVSTAGPRVAKMTMLVIGTEANIGRLSGFLVFQAHQRSCGPNWSNTS